MLSWQKDPRYSSKYKLNFVNSIIKKGNKLYSDRMFKNLLLNIKRVELKDPNDILYWTMVNLDPAVDLQAVRQGGVSHRVPRPINERRRILKVVGWLLKGGKGSAGVLNIKDLAKTVVSASKGAGVAFDQKLSMYKEGISNIAYMRLKKKKRKKKRG